MSENLEIKDSVLYVKELSCRKDGEIGGGRELKNISFSFGRKGIHGILAPKHSGKSLLMDILAGCESADSGEVLLCGMSISENALEYKKRIGYVQKKNAFYPDMTATELLSLVGETRQVESAKLYRQIKEAMELTGLEEIKNRLVRKMTGFEIKKLAIAAALLGNPDILLLDEAVTPRMGDGQRTELVGLIEMLGRMKTVVIATDDYKLARELCEDVLIISDGQTLAKGSFDALEERLRTADGASTLEELYNSLVLASDTKKQYGEKGESK